MHGNSVTSSLEIQSAVFRSEYAVLLLYQSRACFNAFIDLQFTGNMSNQTGFQGQSTLCTSSSWHLSSSLFSMYSANIYVIGNHIFLFQHVVLVVCWCPILDCVNGKPMMVSGCSFLAFKPTSESLEEKRSAFQWALFSRLQALLSVQSLMHVSI